MKIILLSILLAIVLSNSGIIEKSINSPNSISLIGTLSYPGLLIYADPFLMENDLNGQTYLIAFFYDDNCGYLKIVNKENKEVFSYHIKRRAMNRYLCFYDQKYFYFFSDKLFRLDINNFGLDSVNLDRKNYNSISIVKNGNNKVLAAKWSVGLDIYNFYGMKRIKTFGTEFSQADRIKMSDNKLIFRSTENELTAYDFRNDIIKWKLSTGRVDVKLWGIKIGRFNNFISSYQLVKNNGSDYLYVATAVGDLYKLDALSGKVLIKKERFRGDGNNSGLITDLRYADLNKDGVQDLIGPSVDYHIYCLNGKDLSVIWKYDTGYKIQMPLTLCDINGDGIQDIFGVNDKMKLTILNGKNGNCISQLQIDGGKNQTSPALGYFYGNKNMDIAVKANKNEIRIYKLKVY